MINPIFEAIHKKCIIRETRGTNAFDSYVADIFNTELFAELIIEECCKVIEDHYEPVFDGKILLKHFKLGAQGSDDEPTT